MVNHHISDEDWCGLSDTTMLLAMQHLLVLVIRSELAKTRSSQSRLIRFQRLLGESSSVGFVPAIKELRSIPPIAGAPIKQFLWCRRSAPQELGRDQRG